MVVEALGKASDSLFELFAWNREVYSFDQEQRLKRESVRMDMQMERFKLFRSDISNLVDLTVSRMDMYHMVGALVLEFTVTLFTEGRVSNSPVFILSAYMVSTACAFIYLLLAIWLAMHASIASKSFGTRLLLRHVRLPLPTNAQIDALASNLADYERQGLRNMLRVPIIQDAQWSPPQVMQKESSKSSHQELASQGQRLDAEAAGRRRFLEDGQPYRAASSDVLKQSTGTPGEHVELFQRLQAKWSCYDAYSRVCMSMGMNQILHSLSYYLVSITLVANDSPTLGYSVVIILQVAAAAVAVLDISGYRRITILVACAMNALPPLGCAVSLTLAERDSQDVLATTQDYPFSFLIFLAYLLWTQIVLFVSSPVAGSNMPKNFRAVFYMDVFGIAEDPMDISTQLSKTTPNAKEQGQLVEEAEKAKNKLMKSQKALALWSSVPEEILTSEQLGRLQKNQKHAQIWHGELQTQLDWCIRKRLLPELSRGEHPLDARHFQNVGVGLRGEQSADTELFQNAVLGPFEHELEARPYYLDASGRRINEVPNVSNVVSLALVSNSVLELEESVRSLRGVASRVSHGSKQSTPPPVDSSYSSQLPWKVFWAVTRIVQVVLVWLLVTAILAGFDIWSIDVQVSRRLLVDDTLRFSSMQVEWPHEAFFEPVAMSCLPAKGMLISSPFRQFGTDVPIANRPLKLTGLPDTTFPASAVAVCGHAGEDTPNCLMVLLGASGLSVWPIGHSEEEKVVLPFTTKPWQLVSGAITRCGNSDTVLPELEHFEWCLFLAGWDGNTIPLALVPLVKGHPKAGAITPYFDIPVDLGIPPSLTALRMEAQGTRLWALSSSRTLYAWDVQQPVAIGKWSAMFEDSQFYAVAMCEDGFQNLMVVGVTESGPELARTNLLDVPRSDRFWKQQGNLDDDQILSRNNIFLGPA
jgi:hypothetical protein